MLDGIRCKTFLNCFVYEPEQAIEPEQFHLVRFHWKVQEDLLPSAKDTHRTFGLKCIESVQICLINLSVVSSCSSDIFALKWANQATTACWTALLMLRGHLLAWPISSWHLPIRCPALLILLGQSGYFSGLGMSWLLGSVWSPILGRIRFGIDGWGLMF